ncbi:MAG: PASTA domain-containing protein [Acidimicrobiia bacterium]|nr:PASTA domain-containing protein [Acidimicrobiia bacterium]
MSRTTRLALVAVIPILILLLPVLAFAADRSAHDGEVWRNVSAGSVQLGGLSEADAMVALRAEEASLAIEPVRIVVEGSEFSVPPSTLGLALPAREIVDEAMVQRRGGGFFAEFQAWFRSFTDDRQLGLRVSLDPEAVSEVLRDIEGRAVDAPAFEGGLIVTDGVASAQYPRTGLAVDRDGALPILLDAATGVGPRRVELSLAVVDPVLTSADIDAAVTEANTLMREPVTLTSRDPEVSVVFTPEELGNALRFAVDDTAAPRLDLWLDVDTIDDYLKPHRSAIERDPVDASFLINSDETVTIVPSRSGTVVDAELVAAALYDIALGPADSGPLPIAEGAAPDFTSDDAVAMGTISKVSSFTTFHPTGEPRVVNIQTMAKAIDGAVVWPGDSFSINTYVGQRTIEKGYVPAPMILNGELVDDVGGGVSQFATTFYNAVFFGCYEDVTHTPHSRYISRYPEGREATISWGGPELIFRNNSDAVVIIDTAFTAGSITVTFYGNNGGLDCEASLSDRFDFREPGVEYEADPTRAPGSPTTIQSGTQGWSVTVTRTIIHPDGSTEEEKDTHAYQPIPQIIQAHPCDIPQGEPGHTGEPCPLLVPSVIGMTQADAIATLEASGFSLVVSAPVEVAESAAGLVALQSPDGGSYASAGATVSVAMGVYTAPPTTTTTTTAPPPTTTTTTTSMPPDEGSGSGG